MKKLLRVSLLMTFTFSINLPAFADYSDIIQERAHLFLNEECNQSVELNSIIVVETASTFSEDERQIFYSFTYDYNVLLDTQLIGEAFLWGKGEESKEEVFDSEVSLTCPSNKKN